MEDGVGLSADFVVVEDAGCGFFFVGEGGEVGADVACGEEFFDLGVLPDFFGEDELGVVVGEAVGDVGGGVVVGFGFLVDVGGVGVDDAGEGDGCGVGGGVVVGAWDEVDGVGVVGDGEGGSEEVLYLGDEFFECPVWECVGSLDGVAPIDDE